MFERYEENKDLILFISLTVEGSSNGVSISACLKNTFPLQALHNIRSKAGSLSLRITPATKLLKKNLMKIKNSKQFIIQENKSIYGQA